MISFTVGEVVRVSSEFTDDAGAHVTPGGVLFKYKSPDGGVITYTSGVDAALVNDGVGLYHVDINASSRGVWQWRSYSINTYQAAKEGSFMVEDSFFS